LEVDNFEMDTELVSLKTHRKKSNRNSQLDDDDQGSRKKEIDDKNEELIK